MRLRNRLHKPGKHMITFTSFRQAMDYLTNPVNKNKPEYQDALAYAIHHAPPEMMEGLRKIRQEVFPELIPDHVDDAGNPYFSTETIRKHLGMTHAEMDQALKDMVEQSKRMGLPSGISTVDSRKLTPVN